VGGEARAETPLAVVVSAEWEGMEEISIPVLRQLYLGRRTRLQGRRVRCVDLPAGSRARGAFTRSVIGRSERAVERYWLRQTLAGGPPPPRELDAAAALAWVAREPGVLGYLEWNERAPPAGVRVLAIVVNGRALRPGDLGYPIRVPASPSP